MRSNQYFGKAREGFATKQIDWLNDDIRAVLVSRDYAPKINGDEFLSDVPVSARIAFSQSLSGKSADLGVLDSDDPVFARVTGNEVDGVLIYQHTGLDETSRLIADLRDIEGFPFMPSKATVVVEIDEEKKIGKL